MKKFCIKALIFAACCALTLLGLDYLVTKGLKMDKQSNLGVWNTIYEGKLKSEIIISGSSRAVYHIDPMILTKSLNESSYNLGMDGQMFEIQYCRFKVFLQHNPPPKVVIQAVDCHTLCKTEGLYEYQQFLPFLNDSIMHNTLADKQGLSKNDFVLPMARYAGEFKLMFHAFKLLADRGDVASNRYNGFEGQDRSWNGDLEAAKKMYPEKLEYILNNSVIAQFEEYIQYCKTHNIKLYLVYTPEYIEGQKLIKNRKAIINLYERISKKHDVPFLNYSNSKLSANRNLFYNALHLNIHGARLFTAELAADLKRLNYESVRKNSEVLAFENTF